MKMTHIQMISDMETAAHELARESWRDYKKSNIVQDEFIQTKIELLQKRKVKDMVSALADEIYNDKGFISDMLGDKIYDVGKDLTERLQIISEFKKMKNFEAWNEAMKELETTMI